MMTTNRFIAFAIMIMVMGFASCSRDDNNPTDPTEPKITEGYMPYLGHMTYYRLVGERQDGKAPIILLHGGPGSTHNYFEVLDELAATGHQLVMYDQIGCGNSYLDGHPELWNKEVWLDELEALVKHLKIDRYHLLGQSWGGMMAIALCCDRDASNVESVILSSACPSASMWSQEQHRRIRETLSQEEQNAIARAEATGNFEDEEYIAANDHYMTLFSNGPYTTEDPECLWRPKKFGQEAYLYGWGPNEYVPTGTLCDFEYLDKMKNMTVPTLVINGSSDLCSTNIAKAMHDNLPHSKWIEFEGARHMVFADANADYLHLVKNWLLSYHALVFI